MSVNQCQDPSKKLQCEIDYLKEQLREGVRLLDATRKPQTLTEYYAWAEGRKAFLDQNAEIVKELGQ